MKNKKLLIVILSIIAVAVVGFYLSNLKPQKKKVYIGYQGIARINSLLAAEEFFTKTGHEAKSYSTFSMKHLQDEYISVIVCPISALPKTTVELDFLKHWLKDGGHLITGIRKNNQIHSSSFTEEFKKFLKIQEIQPCLESTTEEVQLSSLLGHINEAITLDLSHTVTPAKTRNMKIIKVGENTAFFETYIQDGIISFFSDLSIFENKHIDEAQHAKILYNFISGPDEYENLTINFYYGQNVESLYSWFWNNALSGLTAMLLLIILYIANRSRRFGPIEQINFTTRRKLMEHIKASAIFYTRLDEGHSLYAELRQTIFESLAKRFPHIAQQALGRELSKLTGINEQELSDALTEPIKNLNIVESTKTLQNLRKYL